MWVVVHFRHYFNGKPFTVITDHQPLEWPLTNDKLTAKHTRWSLILQHPLPSTVDHDDDERDKVDAVTAEYADVWHRATAAVVIIVRAAGVQPGLLTRVRSRGVR